jgi:hypothetical protein
MNKISNDCVSSQDSDRLLENKQEEKLATLQKEITEAFERFNPFEHKHEKNFKTIDIETEFFGGDPVRHPITDEIITDEFRFNQAIEIKIRLHVRNGLSW